MNFWKELKRPFFILAPMDDVTDVVFREIVSEVAKPDVLFTEFVNVEGICSEGFKAVSERLKFTPNQHPIVAQIWGLKPDNFFKAAGIIKEMGFDGIDLNMGCPVKDVMKTGACSALIDNEDLAREIIEATIKGADGLPVTVKTRLGTKKIDTERWINFLLQFDLAAITVHGRISKEMSKKPANWEEIGKAVEIRDKIKPECLIIGNGDVMSRQQGEELAKKYGVDGVMIGRGIFEDIAIFSREERIWSIEERIKLLLRHARLYKETFGDKKHFLPMRKFAKVYIRNFEGSVELRAKLMECNTLEEMERVCQEYLS